MVDSERILLANCKARYILRRLKQPLDIVINKSKKQFDIDTQRKKILKLSEYNHNTRMLKQLISFKRTSLYFINLLTSIYLYPVNAFADIHTAPVVIPAHKISRISGHPVSMYRLFRSNDKGEAAQIPFQIDEINEYTDYVLPNGPVNNANTSNGIFDNNDELSFMGDDVGVVKKPTSWKVKKPSITYELKISKSGIEGAVYVGIYFSSPPTISDKSYVVFDRNSAEIRTSRFRYQFDRKNYLVVRGVDLKKRDGSTKQIIKSSTFYMKADLKYFLTLEANHREIDSELEAYKSGPVRTIVRVSFSYSLMKLKFDLGMYTEVSFFSNAVYLPAIMYNPLDGGKSLNEGSGFYYGFNVVNNPANLSIRTNMPPYRETNILDFLSGQKKVEPLYWVTATAEDHMMYMEISPSTQMRKTGNVPMLYEETKDGRELINRKNDVAMPLGKSPVNLAMFFDLTRFVEGEHIVAFRLFFENIQDKDKLEEFKSLGSWIYKTERI